MSEQTNLHDEFLNLIAQSKARVTSGEVVNADGLYRRIDTFDERLPDAYPMAMAHGKQAAALEIVQNLKDNKFYTISIRQSVLPERSGYGSIRQIMTEVNVTPVRERILEVIDLSYANATTAELWKPAYVELHNRLRARISKVFSRR